MSDSLIRTSRTRRAVAFIGWGTLGLTAFLLVTARSNGVLQHRGEPVTALVLSLFAAFVGVFSWLLFNPGRRSAGDSPALTAGAIATLFPPPVICYCLLGGSSLAPWLSLGVFLICVVAILSEVPDDFFGIPRDRSSYFVPLPVFDRVEGDVMDPDAPWFHFNDLSEVVADIERPSLAPRSYRQEERLIPTVAASSGRSRPYAPVDDYLTDDGGLGLLDEPLWEGDDDDDFVDANLSHGPSTDRRPPVVERTPASGPPTRPQSGTNRRRSRSSLRERQDLHAADTVAESTDRSEAVISRPSSEVTGRTEQKTVSERSAESSLPADTGPRSAPRSTRWSADTENRARGNAAEKGQPATEAAGRSNTSTVGDSNKPASLESALERRPDSAATAVVQTGAVESAEELQTDSDQGLQNPPSTSLPLLPDAEDERASETEDLSSSIQRLTDDSGAELVEGVLKVRFDRGQKRANLHVPFSPPLAEAPEVECECVGGDDVRLKVPVRQPYGIRIEARRSHADEAIETEVGFAAVTRAVTGTVESNSQATD